jgi:hypothetical protein
MMPKQVQMRRGTTAEHAGFTGAQGEVTVYTDRKALVVHDGATAGGVPVARLDEVVRLGVPGVDETVRQRVCTRLWITGGDDAGAPGLQVQHAAEVTGVLSVRTRLETAALAVLPSMPTPGYEGLLNFASGGYRKLTLTGDVTFSTVNLAAGRLYKVVVVADGGPRGLVWPGWRWVGGSAPASLAANKVGLLEVLSTGTTDEEVVARWSVEA